MLHVCLRDEYVFWCRTKPHLSCRIRLDPTSITNALAAGADGHEIAHVSVALEHMIERPSPSVCFAALDPARSGECSILEAQLALSSSGALHCPPLSTPPCATPHVGDGPSVATPATMNGPWLANCAGLCLPISHVFILAKRYNPGSSQQTGAGKLLWPALVRDIGVVADAAHPVVTPLESSAWEQCVGKPLQVCTAPFKPRGRHRSAGVKCFIPQHMLAL